MVTRFTYCFETSAQLAHTVPRPLQKNLPL